MTELQERLAEVRESLPEGVKLVAVSKFHSTESMLEAYDFGQRIFGESRVQELQQKVAVMPSDVEWHFIGHLQINKVKYLAPYVSLIHAVDSLRLLVEIDRQAARVSEERRLRGLNPAIRVLLQLHVALEETKYGFSLAECKAFLDSGEWRRLEHVEIAGIMCMASNTDDTEQIAAEFREAEGFFQMARRRYFPDSEIFCECSWGMSNDYHIAVANGSTLVRVGSYIFGARELNTSDKNATMLTPSRTTVLLAENQTVHSDAGHDATNSNAVATENTISLNAEADYFYQEGLAYAQHQEWGRAASSFRKAIALDPDNPAVESLSMINDILEYYHKDNFNP